MQITDTPLTSADSDAFSLDDLLAESLQQKGEREAEKLLRKKVASGRGTKQELEEGAATLKKLTIQREWERKANVLVFTRQHCASCKTFHTTLIGKFELHHHVTKRGTTMMTAVKGFELDLPKEVSYHDAVVPVCHACADFDGWPLEE